MNYDHLHFGFRLFEQIDRNGDNSISRAELKELMMGIKFGDIPFDVDEVVSKVIEVFDKSGNCQINEEEFVAGLVNLLDTSGEGNKIRASKLNTSQDDFYQVRPFQTWLFTQCQILPYFFSCLIL